MAANWQSLLAEYPIREMTVEGRRYSYRQAGSGPDLVLLHGIGSGSGSWINQLVALSAGCRVTAWDAPGYGGSDCLATAEPSAGDYALALSTLMGALGIDQASVVGHSLGALMAGSFAANYPERVETLVLASPALGYGQAEESVRNKKKASRVNMMADLGANGMARERAAVLLSDEATDDQLAQVRWHMSQLREEGYAAAAHMLAFGDLAADASRIERPFHVLCGAGDVITTAEASRDFAQAQHGATYDEIPIAGHALYIEKPDGFNDFLSSSLKVAA